MGVDISRLNNGLTIVTHTMAQIESVALGIWVKSGSRNERAEEHGIAHMLEHMAFKGTENRTAYQIATDIEDVGGEINAATSVETTAYFARVLKDDMPLAVDILADIITSSKFEEEELEREKQVVLQEINATQDTPDDIVFDYFTETAFRHQTIGRPILGTPDSVRSFTSDNLRSFMNEHYSADRMIVIAAGAVEHEQFVREVESRLGSFRAHSVAPLTELANYVGGDFREYRNLKTHRFLSGLKVAPIICAIIMPLRYYPLFLAAVCLQDYFRKSAKSVDYAIPSMLFIGVFLIRVYLVSTRQPMKMDWQNWYQWFWKSYTKQARILARKNWIVRARNIALI